MAYTDNLPKPKKPRKFRVPLAARQRYPRVNTMAERILDFIVDNPDVTTNTILKQLDLNPSPARKCLRTLLEHKIVTDTIDAAGHHHWKAVQSRL